MADEMVMRSVYLRPSDDARLRELAYRLNVTKSDLIRSAIALKLADWHQMDDDDSIQQEVKSGKRQTGAAPRQPAAAGAVAAPDENLLAATDVRKLAEPVS